MTQLSLMEGSPCIWTAKCKNFPEGRVNLLYYNNGSERNKSYDPHKLSTSLNAQTPDQTNKKNKISIMTQLSLKEGSSGIWTAKCKNFPEGRVNLRYYKPVGLHRSGQL